MRQSLFYTKRDTTAQMSPILVYFHCGSNTGYAIASLERVFLEMARRLVGDDDAIHFGFTDLSRGHPELLPQPGPRVIVFDPATEDPIELDSLSGYVRTHGIELAVGFDQPVHRKSVVALRQGGVRTLISYWGAPMSSLNSGPLLWLKNAEVRLRRHRPNHFVFESERMRETAIFGRGIPSTETSVIPLGVDTERFRPIPGSQYAHRAFGIPPERRLVLYSGHMEPRKGVRVILDAAIELVDRRGRRDIHFLLLGDQPGEASGYRAQLADRVAADHVTFGGYRDDVAQVFPSCYCGTIASTGWDSFTMSSLEMAASGLPLVLSKLQGLAEALEPGVTGFHFQPGDSLALADALGELLDNPALRDQFGQAGRERILRYYTTAHQVDRLTRLVRTVASRQQLTG